MDIMFVFNMQVLKMIIFTIKFYFSEIFWEKKGYINYKDGNWKYVDHCVNDK